MWVCYTFYTSFLRLPSSSGLVCSSCEGVKWLTKVWFWAHSTLLELSCPILATNFFALTLFLVFVFVCVYYLHGSSFLRPSILASSAAVREAAQGLKVFHASRRVANCPFESLVGSEKTKGGETQYPVISWSNVPVWPHQECVKRPMTPWACSEVRRKGHVGERLASRKRQ